MLSRMVLATVFVALSGSAMAAAKSSKDPGLGVCEAWCLDHNKTGRSQGECVSNCLDYYCGKGKQCPMKAPS